MPSLSTNKLAPTTARFGAMRFGAFRFGYTPRETVNAAQTGDGPLNPYTRSYPAATSYTTVRS